MSVIPQRQVRKLSEELLERLANVRATRAFNPTEWIEERTDQLLVYLQKYKLKACVISMSGGVDSSAVAALLKRAQDKSSRIPDHPFNPANGGKIVCVAQPFHSTVEVQNRAYEVASALGLSIITVDRSEEFDTSMSKVEAAIGCELNGFSKAMSKSYMRTPINFLLASHYGGIVVGTGNKDEDGYLYYYCKFGDGAVDVGLIWDLHKHEVYQIAQALNVPSSVLSAAPTADLSPGQTDEEEIGATYDAVELVTNYVRLSPAEKIRVLDGLSDSSFNQFHNEFQLIEAIHARGIHKADLNPKNIGSTWYLENMACMDAMDNTVAASANNDYTSAVISMSMSEATALAAYMQWTEDRQSKFLCHFEKDEVARSEFKKKLQFIRSIRSL